MNHKLAILCAIGVQTYMVTGMTISNKKAHELAMHIITTVRENHATITTQQADSFIQNLRLILNDIPDVDMGIFRVLVIAELDEYHIGDTDSVVNKIIDNYLPAPATPTPVRGELIHADGEYTLTSRRTKDDLNRRFQEVKQQRSGSRGSRTKKVSFADAVNAVNKP